MTNLFLSVADLSASLINFLQNTFGIWYTIILNAFGVIAITLKVVEYQSKSRRGSLIFAILSDLFWASYFALQGNFVSALMCTLAVGQFVVFLQREKHAWAGSKIWLVVFFVLQGTSGVLTFINWYDVFAISAGLITVVMYYVFNRKAYRALSFFYVLFWLLNSAFNGYLLPLLNDSFSMVSVIVAIVRFDIIPILKKEKVDHSKGLEGQSENLNDKISVQE